MGRLADVAQALRTLRRRPGQSAVVVLILALGITSTVAVYSIVSAVVLRPLPFASPEALVRVRQTDPDNGIALFQGASGPSFQDWQRESTTLVSMGAYSGPGGSILAAAGEPRRVQRTSVTGDFFGTLGLTPALGRLLRPGDTEAGAPRVAVLSSGFWQRELGGAPDVLGRNLVLDGESYEVVGVARPGGTYPEGTAVWTAIPADAEYFTVRYAHILGVVGRLAPGATAATAEDELDGILAEVPGYTPRSRVTGLKAEMVGDVRTPMLALLGAVVFVLLVAAANAGNLLLAWSARRGRELAIRSALGAGRRRLAAQLVAESTLLALAAGLLGTLLAAWLLDALVALAPGDLPRGADIRIDAAVLAFALAVSLLTGVLTGLIPALRVLARGPGDGLRDGDARAGSRSGRRVVGGFVVAEVALSVMLLSGAGLLVRSFLRITAVDPGFRAEHVTTFEFALPGYEYGEPWQLRRFGDGLLERVRALPGVEGAAVGQNLPVAGSSMITPALVEGRATDNAPRVQVVSVSDDYFRTMGMQVVAGRAFTSGDDGGAPPVAMVDEAFARLYFDGDDPVGRRARTYFGEPVMRDIVGVVASAAHESLTEPPQPTFYYPAAQMPPASGRLVVRSTLATPALVAAVQAARREVDATVPFGDIATMEQLLQRTTAAPRFYATTVAAFALLALVLAVAGFVAVLSQVVTRRRREMGVRLAVGARPAELVGLVVGYGMRLTALGLALGLAGALAVGRLLAGLLFGVGPADPLVLGGVAALLAGVALLAAWAPARRAAGTDPMAALRAE